MKIYIHIIKFSCKNIMGILEFFGNIVKNNITSGSVKKDFREKWPVDHLLIDFNSIIYNVSKEILDEINLAFRSIMENLEKGHSITHLVKKIEVYRLKYDWSQIRPGTNPEVIVQIFQDHFQDKVLDKIIIVHVIKYIVTLLRTYCQKDKLKTLLICLDGVPSKPKFNEQKQRRYMSIIMKKYEMKILKKNKKSFKENYLYCFYRNEICWNTGKLTPGSPFMDRLAKYLRMDEVGEILRKEQKNVNYLISDVHEIGEGEKKILNYLKHRIENKGDCIFVYSPDADMILLCLLLKEYQIYILRVSQQSDLIDINMLKKNIAYFINKEGGKFDEERIIKDIIFLSTIFGNDFLPKIETINVKRDFSIILEKYLSVLQYFKNQHMVQKVKGQYQINAHFFKKMIESLLPEEEYFIKYNQLCNNYLNIGQIRNAFAYMEITPRNIIQSVKKFQNDYRQLQNEIVEGGDFSSYLADSHFFYTLKRSLNLIIDNQPVNIYPLDNMQIIGLLQKYYEENGNFPQLTINLNTKSSKITDPYHQKKIKGMNNYQKELYQFRNMLDMYQDKFNARNLNLSEDQIPQFYLEYFHVEMKNPMTPEEGEVIYEYLEGLVWVFQYYFNSDEYINYWYYQYDKSPLLRDIYQYLLKDEDLESIRSGLTKYQVTNLKDYFNPLEQYIYISPMVRKNRKYLPKNYREYIKENQHLLFFQSFFISPREIVEKLWKESVSSVLDCKSIPYLNKCIIDTLRKHTKEEDWEFIQKLRKIGADPKSTSLSLVKKPPF